MFVSDMTPTTSLHVMISSLFFLALSNNTLANSGCPDDGGMIDHVRGCPTGDVKAVMLPFPPYMMLEEESATVVPSGIVFKYIDDSFERCCPYGLAVQIVNDMTTDPESDTFSENLASADVIFPVTETLETQLTFSGIRYTFHDIVKTHGYVLIGRIDHYNKKARSLVLRSLYDSWPIFAMTFLLAGIAGIFIWALEYHVKNEEFPLSFTRGSCEGFWWAFISMTTVGYGDKTPRSFIGRLFGVLWILLGLIVVTMFTATITSALTLSSSPQFSNSLEGQDVGVLSQDIKAQAEANYSGAIPHLYDDVEDLYDALVNEDVDGIFMERLQAYYHYSDKTEDENLRIFDAIYAEITYKMALKKSTTCKFLEENFCFKRRIEYPLTDSLVKDYTVPLKVFKPSVDTEGLLSGGSSNTGILLLAILGVFVGLVLLGVLVDIFVLKSEKRLCSFWTLQKRRVSAESSPHASITSRQLESLSEDLENLSSQVLAIKERLTGSYRHQTKFQTSDNLKLTEVDTSVL